jgi:hypothetical protein
VVIEQRVLGRSVLEGGDRNAQQPAALARVHDPFGQRAPVRGALDLIRHRLVRDADAQEVRVHGDGPQARTNGPGGGQQRLRGELAAVDAIEGLGRAVPDVLVRASRFDGQDRRQVAGGIGLVRHVR